MHCFATQTPSYNASHRQQTSTASSPDKLDRAPTPSVKPLYSLRENAVFCEFISDFCVRQAPRLRIEPAVETGNGRRRGAAAAPVGMVWRRRWPVAISGSTPPAGAEAPFGTACLAGRHIRSSLIAGRFKPGSSTDPRFTPADTCGRTWPRPVRPAALPSGLRGDPPLRATGGTRPADQLATMTSTWASSSAAIRSGGGCASVTST